MNDIHGHTMQLKIFFKKNQSRCRKCTCLYCRRNQGEKYHRLTIKIPQTPNFFGPPAPRASRATLLSMWSCFE